ncbi:hypothetical protein RhiirC2_786548 [Rhizophagus irregularis]|uniref:Uncharacterized protein n=1 Tax=Rhizophagus irregularis TaxID=588596 RepID=A0A2N1MU21_9GLOM|nr:hypothetical protein RhiirC2_786548 [Rhizophagus irregularis]
MRQRSDGGKKFSAKIKELKEIFKATSTDEMEWEDLSLFGYRIISLAEQTDILRQYTMLNDDFTKRLKDENRATDDENVNKKRFKNSPPAKKFQKRWRVEDKEQYWISKSQISLLLGGFWVLRSQNFREAISYLALFTVFLTEGLNTKSRKFNE